MEFTENQIWQIVNFALNFGQRFASNTNYMINAFDVLIENGDVRVTEVCVNEYGTPYYGDTYTIFVDPGISFSGRVRNY